MWSSYLILLTLPQLYMCQFDWKVEQPVSYVIYNGKYYPNPTANIRPLEEEASASSFLEGLNPLNAFSTIWNSLPSLNIFGTSDLVDDESDFTDAGGAGTEGAGNEYQQKVQHGSTYSFVPSLHNVGGNGLFAGSPAPIKAELPFNLDKIAAHPSNPFQQYNARRRRRSPSLSPRPGSTLTFYKPLGQGSYMKYEIIPEDDHANKNEAGKERRRPRPVERPSPTRPLKSPLTPYKARTQAQALRRYKAGEHNSRKYSTSQSKSVERTESVKTEMEESPCPKFGNWEYDGEMCISIGPIPKWACRPKDLLTTGKLVVCRNKIFFP